MEQSKKFYPKWISKLLLTWLPALIYLALLMLIKRDENSWILLFIVPIYLFLIYLFKNQKIPKEAKPVYISKIGGYAFFIVFSLLLLAAIVADIWSKESIGLKEIFSIILSFYVFLSISIVSYLLASHRIPSGYVINKG